MFLFKKRGEKKKEDTAKTPKTREEFINDPNTPENTKKIFKQLNEQLKEQDSQIEAFNKAKQLAAEGKAAEAISIVEKIMYEEGLLIIGVTWPFILSDLYLKNNMNNECWKYLNYIVPKYPEMQDKIDEVRVKILKKEGKHLDAMATKMRAILFKHSKVEFKPTEEKIEKDLTPFIKRANMIDKKAELLSLMNKHLEVGSFGGTKFRDELKIIVK